MNLKRALEIILAEVPALHVSYYIDPREYMEALRVAEHYIETSYEQIEVEENV